MSKMEPGPPRLNKNEPGIFDGHVQAKQRRLAARADKEHGRRLKAERQRPKEPK